MNVQQRAILSKRDFETELDLILTDGVVEKNGVPDGSQIALASEQTRRIIDLLDRFLLSRGIHEV